MSDSQQQEIDRNYDYFQRNLSKWLSNHRGQHALLRDRKKIGFFDSVGDAYRTGLKQFPDEQFSIQEVTDEPAHMGFLSVAIL